MGILVSLYRKSGDMLRGRKEKILTIYLIVNVFWIFLGIFSYCYLRFSYQNLSVSYIPLMLFNIVIIFLINMCKKVRFDVKDIFLILFVLCGIISVIFSKDSSVSLYGCWKRFEGFFQLLYYYSLMYLSSMIFTERLKKRIVLFILAFGLIHVFVSFLQLFDILKFIPIPFGGIGMGQGLVTNPNFFGSYMVLCLGISCGIYLFYKGKILNKFLLLIVCILFYSGLLMSSAMSGMVGFFIIILFLIFYFIHLCIKKVIVTNNIISYSILSVSIIIVSLFFILTGKTMMFGDISTFSGQAVNMVNGEYSDDYGSFRFYIWRNTIKVVPKYMLHGVGIDCFYDAFDEPLVMKYSDTVMEYYDKAHNEYLQKLVCEGFISCLCYIILLLSIFILSLKCIFSKHNYLTIGLFLGFVGYCVQAFFNISVIEVAPIFWIVCGLLYNRELKNE